MKSIWISCSMLQFAMTEILSNYAKRMARLSARIFGEVARPTPKQSFKVVEMFKAQPLDKRPDIYDYYPRHIELTSLMKRLRFLGLYRWVSWKNLLMKSSSSFILKTFLFPPYARVRHLPQIKSLHISLKIAHSECKPSSFMSSLTHCSHVFLLLPRPLAPSTTNPLQADTQSSTLLCSRCPNHLILPPLTTSATQLIPRRMHKSSLRLLSFKDTPLIHLTIILYSI